jgi:hypothetical protein
LRRNRARTNVDTTGKEEALTAGRENPPNCSTLSGSLPSVKKIAVEAAINPIARTPKRSKEAKRDLVPVREIQVRRSFGVMNFKLALTAFSIPQV